MNPTQLLSHFDRISEAPGAVPRLRRFILDLAVRGKLVEQDPSDEPASALLKRVQAEKAQSGKGVPTRNDEPQLLTRKIDEPFHIPVNWKWAKLGQVADFVRGVSFSASDKAKNPGRGDLPCFRSGNIQKALLWEDFIYVPQTTLKSNAQYVRRNDILISIANSYELVGKCSIVEEVFEEATFGAFLAAIRLHLLSPRFVQHFLTSGYSANAFRIGSSQTTNIANITFATIREHKVAIPPLAEQHRIVAKVDELMGLCDQLEAAQAKRERKRDLLNAASLQRLKQPAETPGFREYASFHLRCLPRLVERPEQMQQLRQTILNLAVRGQLTPYDPNIEHVQPRSKLLKSTVSGVDSRVFNESVTSLTVPAHWGIEPLAVIAEAIVDCPHSTPSWTTTGKICVRTNQFRPGYLDLSDTRFVSEDTYLERIQRLKPIEDDILYSREGGILGVACRVPPRSELCLGQRMMLIRAGAAINAVFLEKVLNSPFITDIARGRTTGGAAPRVNVATVKSYPIPVPPLAEQLQIVTKIDELMILCNRLEEQLTFRQTESHRLLEAILHHALVPTGST